MKTAPCFTACRKRWDAYERGARFFTLELSLRPELRGRELGADEMNQLECRLVEYKVLRCAPMCAEEI